MTAIALQRTVLDMVRESDEKAAAGPRPASFPMRRFAAHREGDHPMHTDIADLDRQIEAMTDAYADRHPPQSVVDEINELRARRDTLEAAA